MTQRQLEMLAAWIRGHDCAARVEGDRIAVTSQVHTVERGWFEETVYVRNMREARNVLGY